MGTLDLFKDLKWLDNFRNELGQRMNWVGFFCFNASRNWKIEIQLVVFSDYGYNFSAKI
jgi:hypothetical protein